MEDKLNEYKQYLESRTLSQNYYNIMRIWLGYLSKNNIEPLKITQETITKFFQENNTYSINTRNQFIKAGRNYHGFLGQEDNEWKKIRLMKTERKKPNYMSEKNLQEAISYMITFNSRKLTPIKIETLLTFLFYSSCRKGELLILKRKDFNLEECNVKIWGEKTREERMVYYPDKVKKLLINYFNSESEQLNAFNITLGKINYLAQKIQEHFPDKNITTHIWRHSGAHYQIEKGIPIGIVSKLLGHKSIQTTLLYTDPDEEQIKRVYREKIK